MNKRIKLLAKQADAYAHNRMAEIGGSYLEYHNEKFAELIVRECGRVGDNWVDREDTGKNLISDKLKEHFGVE